MTFELPGVWNFHLDREEKRSQNVLLSLFFNLSNVMFRGNCTVHGGKKKKKDWSTRIVREAFEAIRQIER